MTGTESQDPAERILVSLAEAAKRYGVSTKTLRRRISEGAIHGYRVGRFIRVDLHDLEANLIIEIPTTR